MKNDNSPAGLCMSGSNWSGCSRTGTRSSTLWQNWKSSGRSRRDMSLPGIFADWEFGYRVRLRDLALL